MKKYSIVVVIFALIAILGETSINLFEKNNYEKMREELIVDGNIISKNIQKEVAISISAVTLNELFLKNYKFDTTNFNEWSKLILTNYNSILNVQLAPNGIIKYIYPLKGNEKAIGIDLLNDEKRKKAATKEFLTGKVSFIGPVNLIQNNKLAFIARKPIEQNKNGINEFWGFSTVIILVDSIVDSIIGDFDENKYNYSIYGYNLDASNLPLLKSSDKKPSKDSIKFDISIPNGNWTLYLENKENQNLNLNFFRFIVLALAFFVAYAVYKYLSLLYEERNRFKKLIKNSSDGVHVIDINGNMYETSQTFADMLGYSYEETLKLNVRDWNISNETLDKDYVLNRIKNNKSYETIHKRKDGTTYIAEVILKQIDLNGKDYYQASVRDITEFIEQEKQIKELNEQLDEQVKIRTNELNHSLQIVEKNVISSKTDLDGIIIEVTDKFCEISKYSREELLGQKHNIVKHEDNPASMYKEIWETIKSGKTWTGRIKNKNKDGEAYWVDSTISPFYDINGEHVGYFSYRIDVTQEVLNEKIQKEHYEELKINNEKLSIQQEELESQYEELLNAQEKLEKSSQEFIKLFDEAPNVYVMMDKDFKLITYNKKAIKFFNFSMLNTSSQYFPMFIEKDFREDFFEFISLRKYKKEEALDISIEKNRFKMIVDTHPTNKDWYFVTLIDIEKEYELLTTLEATNELLNREYERFNLAIEGSQTGLFDWNLESNSIYFSPKWKELVGYKEYELDNLLETWEDLVHEEDLVKVKQIIQDYLDNPIDVYEATFRMKHKDGHWIWINARGKASLNKDGKPNRMIGFHKDITELIEYKNSLEEKVKKQLEEIRDKDLKMLDQAKMASLGEMMNNIAHQWRQPLNVISISGSAMKYGYEFGGLGKDEMILYIEDIMKSCEYLTKTIETFSKFLSKNKNVEFNSIEKEISSTKYIIESSLKSNLIKLIDEIDYEKEHKCFMVENELSQVILNIISNAEYALNENKTIEDDKWIKITSKEDNDYFTIMIEDNAGGIPMEIISNIFEPYFTTKFQSQGTGLGLSMSYSIIKESIKGDIYVKNTENGAKFYLEIPLNSQLVHTV